jgi:hypothetical protein
MRTKADRRQGGALRFLWLSTINSHLSTFSPGPTTRQYPAIPGNTRTMTQFLAAYCRLTVRVLPRIQFSCRIKSPDRPLILVLPLVLASRSSRSSRETIPHSALKFTPRAFTRGTSNSAFDWPRAPRLFQTGHRLRLLAIHHISVVCFDPIYSGRPPHHHRRPRPYIKSRVCQIAIDTWCIAVGTRSTRVPGFSNPEAWKPAI